MKSKIFFTTILAFLLIITVSFTINKDGIKKSDSSKIEDCGGPFDNINGFFRSNGYYQSTINIPQGSSTSSPSLKPDLVYRESFSSNGNYIVFNLFQHGQADRGPVTGTINREVFSGNLKLIIPNIDTGKAKKIYLVNLHDEDYQDWSRRQKRQFKRIIRKCAINSTDKSFCKCISSASFTIRKGKKDSIFIQPRTVGGGVIPPGN